MQILCQNLKQASPSFPESCFMVLVQQDGLYRRFTQLRQQMEGWRIAAEGEVFPSPGEWFLHAKSTMQFRIALSRFVDLVTHCYNTYLDFLRFFAFKSCPSTTI